MSICPNRFAAATSISPKAMSIGCSGPGTTAASRRWKTRSRLTSGASSIPPIVFADGAPDATDEEFRCSILIPCRMRLAARRYFASAISCSPNSSMATSPAPVIAVQRSETNIGGAGNVARNIAALGARCIFGGLIGEDEAGTRLKEALSQQSLNETVLVCDSERPTTRKVRFVSEHFSTHMLRADWELASPASAGIEQKLVDAILPLLPRADIVLLSDYAKGVLTARVIRHVID